MAAESNRLVSTTIMTMARTRGVCTMKAAPAKKSRKDMPSETGAMVSRTPSCRSAASDGTMSMVTALEIRKQTALMYNATSGDVSDTTTPAAADLSMVANLPRVERMPVDRVNGTPANRVRSGIWLALAPEPGASMRLDRKTNANRAHSGSMCSCASRPSTSTVTPLAASDMTLVVRYPMRSANDPPARAPITIGREAAALLSPTSAAE